MMALVSPDWFDRWGGFGVEEPAHLQDTSHAGVSVLAQQAQCIQWAGARGGGASGWAGPWWHCHPWQSRAIVVSEEEMKPWKTPYGCWEAATGLKRVLALGEEARAHHASTITATGTTAPCMGAAAAPQKEAGISEHHRPGLYHSTASS